MKKIKLSVAALLIATSGFSYEPTSQELIKEISITTEDIIESIRKINTSDSTISRQISEIYVHNLLDVLSKLEDLQLLNCENCDEID